ncbi:hypothetical protein E4T38_08913 [Aureobasidium subglaciale]|nr:hypothetical protein E4T38_08913 [Aureobasidium subglaciale]KAI5214688.1 hypothetical protein E4T40_08841 [Aureobasidium subglaciale]KAI5217567.1 hypothetical protein E4T41_08780 [Aureobasidium subglaciale]KAI5255126.1 hypothetical protein E4T46_08785 [Aureobasidium subglaciale]
MTGYISKDQSWADGPCELIHTPQFLTKKEDIWTKGATHMALLHNAILRGFNTIYLQAPHVQPEDHHAFIGYSLTWYRFVKSHHDDEEAELFPKTFLEGLTNFRDYLANLPSPASFDGNELVDIMDSFHRPFEHHFHHEVDTIACFATLPNTPTPDSLEASLAAATFKAWGKKTLTKAGMTDVVPFALLNLDRTFEGGLWAAWPPMPGPVRWMMVNIFGSWNWAWWKFASCDASGSPRALHALQA